MLSLTAFKSVPPFAQGVVRDLRVRWALEEAGIPYATKLVTREDLGTPAYLALQPFGQVPAIEEDALVLFESGAILLYLGERSPALLPKERGARERAIAWVFAALNSIEPALQTIAALDFFHANERWAQEQRPSAEDAARRRLAQLAAALGEREYLEGNRFTAGDLMMTTVLRISRHTQLVPEQPLLAAYHARCEARPAFQRALAAQLADFE
jgi:glutathione S-transferase